MKNQPEKKSAAARLRPGRRAAVIKGQDSSRWTDFYHAVLTISWPVFFLGVAGFYLAINIAFALLYLADPGGIADARAGNFWDAFLFSVHTMSSITYSTMEPRDIYTNSVVVLEAFSAVLNIALITGVVFARFSRPYARVLFSRVAVVTMFDGVPVLMFRAANQRGNQILDANISVTFARQAVTREGIGMRRFEELSLVRGRTLMFALSWTVMHRIDEASPLHGMTAEKMRDMQGELIALLSGTDETLADVIYARHSYKPDHIQWGRRFVDVLSFSPRGQRVVDLHRFHDTEPDGVEEA